MFKMKKLFFTIILSIFLLNSSKVFAKRELDLFSPKRETPSAVLIDSMSRPDVFGKSNNLTRSAGSFNVAIGEPLYLKGIITDSFGVPIEGAIVKIWQTNSTGEYHSLLEDGSDLIDPNFLMSGESVSDNLGKYGFLTIFPGFYKDRAPHINIIITHKDFGQIETEVYFESHPRNLEDPHYLSYEEKDRNMIISKVVYVNRENHEEGKIATFNITMEGIHQYKGF